MRIAFLCLAHSNQKYLERLARFCLTDGDDIYIHIDRRSELDRERIRAIGANVVSRSESAATKWGSYALVEATLMLLRLSASQHYDRYMLISGADLPIKSKKTIKRRLSQKEVWMVCWHSVTKYGVDNDYVKWKGVYKRHHYDWSALNPRVNPFPNDVTRNAWEKTRNGINKCVRLIPVKSSWETHRCYYHGSQFWALSDGAIKLVLDEYQKNARRYRRRFSVMMAPDEVMLQTILMHSEYAKFVTGPTPYPALNDTIHHNDRFRLRDRGRGYLNNEDIPKLRESAAFFARKVHPGKSARVVDELFGGVKSNNWSIEN